MGHLPGNPPSSDGPRATQPEEILLRQLLQDLAGFAEGFVRAVRSHGAAAAEGYLGGYVEWLGVDLVDGLLILPRRQARTLDALAEELLGACRECQKDPSPTRLAAVAAVGRKARRIRT